MSFLVRQRSSEIAVTPDMGSALAVVRKRIEGYTPRQASLLELEIAKTDARGRVRRTVSGRGLVALALGVPEADLFGYGDWRNLDEAAQVGSNLELELVPDDGRPGRGRWYLVVRFDRREPDGALVRDKATLWWAKSLGEAEQRRKEAEARLVTRAQPGS